jgi:hypothetical protein
VEEVLRLYKDVYYDFNIRHFHEKLARGARHPVELHVGAESFAGAGFVAKRRKRGHTAEDECHWLLEKTRFRHTLAGMIVTIHEHLDKTVSVRWGRI